MSPGAAVRNVKAETIAEAHRERVEAEARAYLQSETRKAEAHAATAQVKQLQWMNPVCRMLWKLSLPDKICPDNIEEAKKNPLYLELEKKEKTWEMMIVCDTSVDPPLQSRVEQKRMKEEAKAIENRKKEEARADQVIQAAEVWAQTCILSCSLSLRLHVLEATKTDQKRSAHVIESLEELWVEYENSCMILAGESWQNHVKCERGSSENQSNC